MTSKWFFRASVPLMLLAAGCAPKHAPAPAAPPVPAPPAPKENVFVLLPNADAKAGGIVVSNAAGARELTEPNQAVRVERSDVAPGTAFILDEANIRRLFGATLDILPAAEVRFTLYFDEGKDELNAESQAQIPAIFRAIQERHSTAVSVTGHTDTTGDPQSNYRLGMRRAERVASTLSAKGLDTSHLFVTSHGEADLLIKTPRGVSERRNRRVDVVVR